MSSHESDIGGASEWSTRSFGTPPIKSLPYCPLFQKDISTFYIRFDRKADDKHAGDDVFIEGGSVPVLPHTTATRILDRSETTLYLRFCKERDISC